VKRALLAAGLLTALALAAAAPCAAQPVAKLEVEARGGTQHQKLDRIERKVDQVLEALRVAPPKPPVVDPQPPKPTEPVTPTTPPGDNPFVAWCANGGTVVDYVMLRNGGVWLSAAQEAQARAAGCFAPPATPATPSGPSGPTTGPGFDLGEGDGLVKVNPVNAGQPLTFSFTVRPGATRVVLHVFGAPGAFFRVVTDAVDGANAVTIAGSGQLHQRDVSGISSGRHTYTVPVDGAGQLGVRLEQQ
jgi:hypothetical protein